MNRAAVTGRGPSPLTTALAGFGAIALLAAALTAAYRAYPGYSMLTGYVSELAKHANPGRHWFAMGLVGAGALLIWFSLGLHGLVPNRPGRIAARLLTVSGLAFPVVAAFDLESPVVHFTAAAVLFGGVVLATVFGGVGVLRLSRITEPPHAGRLRAGAWIAFVVFALQVMSTVAGFAYTAVLISRLPPMPPDRLLKVLPAYQRVVLPGGTTFNPVSFLEWFFLFTAAALIFLVSLHALGQNRLARRRR